MDSGNEGTGRGAGLKIAVVGIGTMGSQVLWQLAQDACEVTGYELFAPGHSYGAAGGESRLFRTIQMEDVDYEPVVELADSLYERLESETGFELRQITGALVMGNRNSPDTQVAVDAAERTPARARLMSRGEMEKKFPAFRLDDEDVAIWDGGGGIIRPELTVAAASDRSQELGAEIIRQVRVTRIEDRGDAGVRVVTDEGSRDFDRAVVAVGSWTPVLFPELSTLLEARKLVSAWYLPETSQYLRGVPPFIRTKHTYIGGKRTYVYGLPYADGTAMKIGLGLDVNEPVSSPDEADRRVSEEVLEIYGEAVRRYMPGLHSYPMRTNAYFESYTESGYEYVQPHPEMPNVLVMAGFSGHGFKMAPAFGRIGADLALGETPSADIGFLHRGVPSNRSH